jgi:calcineurin-like phosphoesterase family protein
MKFNTSERDIWITSDTHFSHKNLIKSLSSWESGAHRDFTSINHHNDTLVNNINNNVKKKDVLFLLGDVAFGGYENIRLFMDRIVCDEVHLVLGNHDKHIRVNRDGLKNLFSSVNTRIDVQIDENVFVMDHYPIREWENCHKGWYHLYGHTHPLPVDRFLNGYRSMNVGFDGHPEFRPYHIKEILTLLKDKPIHGHH